MDGGAEHGAGEGALELVAHALGGAEDDDAGPGALGADDLVEEGLLLAARVVDDLDDLRHVLVGRQLVRVADVDDSWVGEELACQLAHLLGPRRGEEERLALRPVHPHSPGVVSVRHRRAQVEGSLDGGCKITAQGETDGVDSSARQIEMPG